MKVFIGKVKSAIGRDGLGDGVCVFEKVIDYKITFKNIEEEDGEVVSPIGNKIQLANLHYSIYFRALERKLGVGVMETLKLCPIGKQNLFLFYYPTLCM